jgi:hypothetical protein
VTVGFDRIKIERKKYGHDTIKKNSRRSRRDPSTSERGSGEDEKDK